MTIERETKRDTRLNIRNRGRSEEIGTEEARDTEAGVGFSEDFERVERVERFGKRDRRDGEIREEAASLFISEVRFFNNEARFKKDGHV